VKNENVILLSENPKGEDITSCENQKEADDNALQGKYKEVDDASVTCKNSEDTLIVSNLNYGPDLTSPKEKSCIASQIATERQEREDLLVNEKESDIRCVNAKESSLDTNVLEDHFSKDLYEKLEEIQCDSKNEDVIVSTQEDNMSSQKKKEDKAKQPTAVLITTKLSPKKPRGKPRGNKPIVKTSSRSSSCRPITSLGTTNVVNRKMTRRGSTGSYNSRSKGKKVPNNYEVEEMKLYTQAHNAECRRRIKNVKSRLFQDTKSFAAYKSARYKESQERKNRVEEFARRTRRLYANREIDFSKKSKRQRDDVCRRRRRSNLKI